MRRRHFLKSIIFLFFSTKLLSKNILSSTSLLKSNFKYIYSNNKLRSEFFKFLKNVFNLFPENQLHQLIYKNAILKNDDKDVYLATQSKLSEITPLFSAITHQLPSLIHQKEEMARQTVILLGEGSVFNGYLEIGPAGRYLDYLEEKVVITGKRYYADGKEPGYSITEMIDRGQIFKGAEFIPLANYRTLYSKIIPNSSLDLVAIYIGFHHCPLELRIPFISSIRDTLRIGGKLILRDHDCKTEDQKTIVALAHDVFNMGTNQSWEYNKNEVRNFYALDFICEFIEKIGFKFNQKALYQEGDPSKNALMVFTKI